MITGGWLKWLYKSKFWLRNKLFWEKIYVRKIIFFEVYTKKINSKKIFQALYVKVKFYDRYKIGNVKSFQSFDTRKSNEALIQVSTSKIANLVTFSSKNKKGVTILVRFFFFFFFRGLK